MAAHQGIRKYSVTLAGHRTSVSVEAPFWDALNKIAKQRGQNVTQLIRILDDARPNDGNGYNLSGAIRVFVLETLQEELEKANARRSDA